MFTIRRGQAWEWHCLGLRPRAVPAPAREISACMKILQDQERKVSDQEENPKIGLQRDLCGQVEQNLWTRAAVQEPTGTGRVACRMSGW